MTVVTEMRALPALELNFPCGLPGMSLVRCLRLEPLGPSQSVFGRLVAPETVQVGEHVVDGLSLVVAAPGWLWPDYAVEIDAESAALLELADPADAVALVVVSVADRLEDCTANLFAPIVCNVRARRATQVVPKRPEGEIGWPLRAPLPLQRAA
jgi:flagellar assembly factor FliW